MTCPFLDSQRNVCNPSSWANLSSRAKKNAPHAVLPFLHCIVWYASQLYQHPQGLWITFLGIRACTFGAFLVELGPRVIEGRWTSGLGDAMWRCGSWYQSCSKKVTDFMYGPRDSRIANGEGSWGFIMYDHDRSCISDQEHSGTSPLPLRFGHIFSRAPAFWMWCTSRTLVVESRSSNDTTELYMAHNISRHVVFETRQYTWTNVNSRSAHRSDGRESALCSPYGWCKSRVLHES